MNEPGQPFKVCVACQQDIHAQATKCQHCETLQSWRRHLTLPATLFSLLLGFSAVLALTFPLVRPLFLPTFDYTVAPISGGYRGLFVRVDNRGREPIVISQVAVYYPGGEALLSYPEESDLVAGDSVSIVRLMWDEEDCVECQVRPQDEGKLSAPIADPMGDDFIPDCGLVVTVYEKTREMHQTLRYEERHPTNENDLRCTQTMIEFLIGRGAFG